MAGRQNEARSGARRKGLDRRQVIIGAAARRFAEFGFEATTVRQIAEDAKLLSGSLYHHFATKEEILGEVVREAAMEQRARAERIAGLDLDPETAFVTLIGAELTALTEQADAYAIIFAERKLFRRSPDFAYLMQARKEAFEFWQAILERGVEQGQFHQGIDTYLTISTIMRMLNTGADWYLHEDGSPIDVRRSYSLVELNAFYAEFVLRSVRSANRAAEPVPEALPLPIVPT